MLASRASVHASKPPALAYRFDFKDRSIAFSGDTAPLAAVATMAKGADVLVHETMYVPAPEKAIKDRIAKGWMVTFEAVMAHAKADHTPSEDVGRIAQEAGVKTLVLSHLIPTIDSISISDDTWREPVANILQGRNHRRAGLDSRVNHHPRSHRRDVTALPLATDQPSD